MAMLSHIESRDSDTDNQGHAATLSSGFFVRIKNTAMLCNGGLY